MYSVQLHAHRERSAKRHASGSIYAYESIVYLDMRFPQHWANNIASCSNAQSKLSNTCTYMYAVHAYIVHTDAQPTWMQSVARWNFNRFTTAKKAPPTTTSTFPTTGDRRPKSTILRNARAVTSSGTDADCSQLLVTATRYRVASVKWNTVQFSDYVLHFWCGWNVDRNHNRPTWCTPLSRVHMCVCVFVLEIDGEMLKSRPVNNESPSNITSHDTTQKMQSHVTANETLRIQAIVKRNKLYFVE